METRQNCRTVLVEDLPANEDAFTTENELGPHARVAQAIVETIETADGGKVLGLEGSWGAGKSTVVNLVTLKLAGNENILATSFDAWAHEGDPLRRTFLETLVLNLKQRKWVHESHWKNKLDLLANRRKSVQTTSTKKLTLLGILIAFSIMFVPIGISMVSAWLRDNSIIFNKSYEPAWQFIIGMILALLPLVVSILYAVSLFVSRPFSWRKPFTTIKIRDMTSWSFLDGHSDVTVVSESLETPNPTSLEFGDMFRDLLHDALKGSNRKLLLVIDNLDRADVADALRIWSTLQIFLQDTQSRSQEWFRRVWILVPYDPDGLQKLWQGGSESVTTRDVDGMSHSSKSAQQGVAESFFEKSFQVRFQVPPLMLSGWKTLLFRLLMIALPDHKDDDRHKIYRVIDLFRRDRIATPTPRQLKAMVNQIGAIHRQWSHAFPIDHIAYFVLQGLSRRDLIAGLRASSTPTKDAIRLLGADLRGSMAGLAFNVPATKGVELLLSQMIYNSLTDKDANPTGISDLADEHGSGFWQTLEQVADERFNDLAPSTLARIAQAFETTRMLDRTEYVETTNVVKALRNAARQVTDWAPFDAQVGSGIAALVRVIRDNELSADLLQSAANTLNGFLSSAESAVGTGSNFIQVYLQLFGALKDTGSEHLIPGRTTLPLSANEWMSACVALAERDQQRIYWNRFWPSCGTESIVMGVVALINDGRFGEAAMKGYEVTKYVAPAQLWDASYAPFRARLDAGANASPEEVRWLLLAYMGMKKEGKAQVRPYDELFNNGHVLHHFYNASQSKNVDCRAVCAFGQLQRFSANQRPPGMSGNAEAGIQALERLFAESDTEFASAFLAVLAQHDQLPLLFSILDARGRLDPFVITCLRLIADHPNRGAVFSADTIRARWAFLLAHLNDDEDSNRSSQVLLEGLERFKLAQSIEESEGGFQLKDIPFYSAIVSIEASPASAQFARWCSDCVAGRSVGDWTADLQDRFVLTEFALLLAERGSPPNLSVSFRDAVEMHAVALCAGGNVPPSVISSRWSNLLSCIGTPALLVSLKVALLRTAADKANGSLSGAFFDVYSMELRNFENYSAALEQAARLLVGLVRHRGPESGLQWGRSILESEPAIRSDAQTKTTMDELKTRLREAIEHPIEDSQQLQIVEMAKALGVSA
jgi:hypothetical protein